MKKKIYKLISCLLAVVLIMTILLPSIAIASDDDIVNCTDTDVSEDSKVSTSIEDAKDTEVKMTRDQIENVEDESKNLSEKNLTENIVEECGEATLEDPKVTTTTTVVEDEISKETTTTVTKEKEDHQL